MSRRRFSPRPAGWPSPECPQPGRTLSRVTDPGGNQGYQMARHEDSRRGEDLAGSWPACPHPEGAFNPSRRLSMTGMAPAHPSDDRPPIWRQPAARAAGRGGGHVAQALPQRGPSPGGDRAVPLAEPSPCWRWGLERFLHARGSYAADQAGFGRSVSSAPPTGRPSGAGPPRSSAPSTGSATSRGSAGIRS